MKVVKSANDQRRKAKAQKEANDAQYNAHVAKERQSIRLNILHAAKGSEKAEPAWELIKNIDYPEITYFTQACYVMLNNDEIPTMAKLEKIVSFLKRD